jgi:2'-5' RNA ligase
VSIPVPEPYGGELRRHRAAFGDPEAATVPAHVTLLPPTPVDRPDVPEIERLLTSVAEMSPPFPLRLRGTGTFRPVSRVVYVALSEGVADCGRLQELVRRGPLGRTLDWPYHPHVTVAHDLPDDVLDHAAAELAGFEAAFSVRGFSLYEHNGDGVWRPRLHLRFGS